MLTVSLHGIRLHAYVGLYPEEQINGNHFIIDTEVWLPDAQPWPFADYTLIREAAEKVFSGHELLIETCVQRLHADLRALFPVAEKIRVCVKKLNPPMPTPVDYSMVCYEA